MKWRVGLAHRIISSTADDRLGRFRHAENRHDHAERVPDRDVGGEVAVSALRSHPIDVGPGERRELRLDHAP
jgi:hypothetical protein